MLLSYITHLNITLQREIRCSKFAQTFEWFDPSLCPLCPLHEQWLKSEDVKHLMFINSSNFAWYCTKSKKIFRIETRNISQHHHHQFRNVSLLLIYSIRFYYRWSNANFMFVLFSIYIHDHAHTNNNNNNVIKVMALHDLSYS